MVLVQGSWRMVAVYGAISIALLLLVQFHVILTPVHHHHSPAVGGEAQATHQPAHQPAPHHAKHRHHN